MLCGNSKLDISYLGFAQGRCQTIEKGGKCAPCDGVTTLEQDIQQRIEELRLLLDRHRALRTEWNSTHDIISGLPAEIVSEIFQYCKGRQYADSLFTVFAENKEPMKLGAVCQRWRQIAWSTPQLWTQIWIHRPKDITPLQEWISRSGCLPLVISIQENGGTRGYNRWKATFQELAKCSQRWRDVYLRMSRMMIKYLLRSVKPSSMICRLHLSCIDDRHSRERLEEDYSIRLWPDFPPVSGAHPAHLEKSTSLLNIMNCSKLTHLLVYQLASTDCRYILGEAPALISLTFNCPNDDFSGDRARCAVLAANPLVHRGLKSFKYAVSCPEKFLSFLTLPCLTYFSYTNFADNLRNADTDLLPFILRSAFPLQKLQLDAQFTYEITRPILMAVPSITTLGLYQCYGDHEVQFMEELFSSLECDPVSAIPSMQKHATRDTGNIHQLLPHLQILNKSRSHKPASREYLRENRFRITRV